MAKTSFDPYAMSLPKPKDLKSVPLWSLFYKSCDCCGNDEQPFEYKRDVLCLGCSIEFNDHMIATTKGRKQVYFLKRRWHLRELNGTVIVPRGDGLERENVTCDKCSKQFVALRINHLKYCGDCTKWKKQMDDLRLNRRYEENNV